jgi:hypothetical protein
MVSKGEAADSPPNHGELLALVDSVKINGTLNDREANSIAMLRAGLMALAEKGTSA